MTVGHAMPIIQSLTSHQSTQSSCVQRVLPVKLKMNCNLANTLIVVFVVALPAITALNIAIINGE